MSKINIWSIVIDHFKTLSLSKDWYFIVLPILFSSVCLYFHCVLDKDMVDILNTGLSIFVGLFFNVIILIFDMVKKTEDRVKQTVLKQTLINICYLILIAILGIMFGYLALNENSQLILIASFLVYFVISHFFLTVVMVLKRIYILFIVEFDETKNNK